MKRVFISHSSRDRKIAREIFAELETAGFAPWLDVHSEQHSAQADFPSMIEQAMRESAAVLLLISAAALDSLNVRREVELAHLLGRPTLPVLLDMDSEEFERRIHGQGGGGLRYLLGTTRRITYRAGAGRQIVEILGERSGAGGEAQELEVFLETRGYQVLERPDLEQEGTSLLLTVGEVDTFKVLCWYLLCDHPVRLEDLNLLRTHMARTPGARGRILSSHAVDLAVRRAVGRSAGEIWLTSLAGFYRKTLLYDPYLHFLAEESSTRIRPFWVEPSCSDAAGAQFAVEEYADGWLAQPGAGLLALLGEFGTGKSWFCQHYAAAMAVRHRKEPDRHRLPLLISLREWSRAQGMEQHVTSMLANQARLKTGDYRTFQHLNRRGRLLLIFDGFDEMEQRVTAEVALANYRQILGTVEGQSKVILTSRPQFYEQESLQGIFEATRGQAGGSGRGEGGRLDLLHLEAFDDRQIKGALRKRAPKEWRQRWQQIRGTERLKKLASRPVMIQILSEVFPTTDIERIDSAALYHGCITEGWIPGACRDHPALLDRQDEVLSFLRAVAFEMLATASGGMPRERFRLLAHAAFASPDFTTELERLFIVDRQSGQYGFPHVSFAEYLVADRIAQSLEAGRAEDLLAADLTAGVVSFLVEIAGGREGAVRSGLVAAIRQARQGEESDKLCRLLAELGDGNPLRALLAVLGETGGETWSLPAHLVEALGRREFLEPLFAESLPAKARGRLLELLTSTHLEPDYALDRLERTLAEDPDEGVRCLAAGVLGRYEKDRPRAVALLLDGVGNEALPLPVRKACLSSLPDSFDGEDLHRRFVEVLAAVMNRDREELRLRQDCVLRLGRDASWEAAQPLLDVLGRHRQAKQLMWAPAVGALSRTRLPAAAKVIEEEVIPAYDLPLAEARKQEDKDALDLELRQLTDAVDSIRREAAR